MAAFYSKPTPCPPFVLATADAIVKHARKNSRASNNYSAEQSYLHRRKKNSQSPNPSSEQKEKKKSNNYSARNNIDIEFSERIIIIFFGNVMVANVPIPYHLTKRTQKAQIIIAQAIHYFARLFSIEQKETKKCSIMIARAIILR